MAVHVGVGGVVKNVSAIKCGVDGVVKNVTHGYNGQYMLKQFWGLPTGIQYFIAIPYSAWVGNNGNTAVGVNNFTFQGITGSGLYDIYKYRVGSVDNAYYDLMLYKNATKSYPRTYCADYIVIQAVPTLSTATDRYYLQYWSIAAVYDNEDFANIDTVGSDGSYTLRRWGWLEHYKSTGRQASTFSLTASWNIYSSSGYFSWWAPELYGASLTLSSWNNNATYNLTANQNSSNTAVEYLISGCGIHGSAGAQYAGTVTQTVKFPNQYITLNGVNYPIYFYFGMLKHS